MSEQLITLVIALREAQKADENKRTRATVAEREKYETRIDNYISNYFADKVQLSLWTRSVKSSETAGAYNVGNEIEEENESGA